MRGGRKRWMKGKGEGRGEKGWREEGVHKSVKPRARNVACPSLTIDACCLEAFPANKTHMPMRLSDSLSSIYVSSRLYVAQYLQSFFCCFRRLNSELARSVTHVFKNSVIFGGTRPRNLGPKNVKTSAISRLDCEYLRNETSISTQQTGVYLSRLNLSLPINGVKHRRRGRRGDSAPSPKSCGDDAPKSPHRNFVMSIFLKQ